MEYTAWNGAEEEAGNIIQHRALSLLILAQDYYDMGNTKAGDNCKVVAEILDATGKALIDGMIKFDEREGDNK